MRIYSCSSKSAEASFLRRILKIVRPSDAVAIQQIKHRSRNRFVTARRWEGIVGGQVTKRSRSHEIGAVGEGRSHNRRKIPVVDPEVLRQAVIERDLVLVIERHRLVIRRALRTINLLRQVVLAHEAVSQKISQAFVRVQKIGFLMRWKPRVVEIWHHAPSRVMKRKYCRTIVIR